MIIQDEYGRALFTFVSICAYVGAASSRWVFGKPNTIPQLLAYVTACFLIYVCVELHPLIIEYQNDEAIQSPAENKTPTQQQQLPSTLHLEIPIQAQ